MTLPNADESLLRRYLLGTVTAESRDGLEARLFSDDRLFWERLSIAEDELVSDYVQNALSGEEQQDFENNFLRTDERRAKVEFAKALHTYAEQHTSRRANRDRGGSAGRCCRRRGLLRRPRCCSSLSRYRDSWLADRVMAPRAAWWLSPFLQDSRELLAESSRGSA